MLDDARNRQPSDNVMIHACTEVLRDRYARLEQLERGTADEGAA